MYIITFTDGTTFDGGEPENTKWNELPNIPIKSVDCWLIDSKYHFEYFEEYCSCVERIHGVNKPLELVSKWIIMGRVKQRVYQVIFDLQRSSVDQLCVPWGQEYNKRPLIGWKQGILPSLDGLNGPKLRKIL